MRESNASELQVVKEDLLQRAESVGKIAEKSLLPKSKRVMVAIGSSVMKTRQAVDGELEKLERKSKVKKDVIVWSAITPIITVFFLFFSRYFPPLTAFLTGPQLYTSAYFSYAPVTKFDDTILTYGTDYVIAAVMLAFTVAILRVPRNKKNSKLILASALLIGSYSLSTLTGAICHHFLPQKLNTVVFRTFWRICVGCVAAAGGIMGSVASEIAELRSFSQTLAKQGEAEGENGEDLGDLTDAVATEDSAQGLSRADLYFDIPVVPHFVWIFYGSFFVLANTVGFFSMKQPACDIFCLGVSQVPATVYLVLSIYSRKSWAPMNVNKRARRILLVGALLNIVLLPGYDLLNFLRLPLGVINTILHTTLLLSWGAQAVGLLDFARGVATTSASAKND